MGFLSEKTVQQIFDTAKVEDVVGDFVHLKKRGINYIGNCPFHNEKTPSFTVSPAKGIYKCFGCGVGGNAVNFVMEHEQLSYVEALRFLAKKYNIQIEETVVSEEYREKQQLADSLYIVNDFAQKHFQGQLFETDYGRSVGLNYFKERGLREETIKRFALGFANGQMSDLTQLAQQKGYLLDILQKAGLATQYGKDFFRNRVQFPIHNLSGKVVGFGGRILTADKKQPKYLNTPETDIYHKNRILYGIYQARKAIVSNNNCYMVEGYMDVLTLSQAGIENVVASSGTSLTIGQIQLVKRYTNNMTILYDGDAAGVKAALRGLELVLEQDMNVKIALLPDGQDPDSYLQQVGLTAFKAFLETEAVDFILFKTRLLLKDTKNDPIRRSELVSDIVNTISHIPDPLKRSVYVKECAALLDINEHILHTEINKRIAASLKNSKPTAGNNAIPEPIAPEDRESIGISGSTDTKSPVESIGHEFLERDIARVLIQFGHRKLDDNETIAEFLLLNMAEVLDEFDSPLYAEVLEIYIQALDSGKSIDTDYFVQYMDSKIANLAVNFIASPYEYSPGWEKLNVYLSSQKMPEENHVADAKSAILRFKLRKFERLIHKNQANIKEIQEKEGDFEEILKFMKVHARLMQLRGEIANQLNTVVLK